MVEACVLRGLHPVLLDLPRDLDVIGRSLDSQVARVKAGCAMIAEIYDVPWVTPVKGSGLVDADFFDLWHLVEPGRVEVPGPDLGQDGEPAAQVRARPAGGAGAGRARRLTGGRAGGRRRTAARRRSGRARGLRRGPQTAQPLTTTSACGPQTAQPCRPCFWKYFWW